MNIMESTQGVGGIARAMIEFASTLIDNDTVVSGTFNVGGIFLEIQIVAREKDERAVQFQVATERCGKRAVGHHFTFYMRDVSETEFMAAKAAKTIVEDWNSLKAHKEFGTRI